MKALSLLPSNTVCSQMYRCIVLLCLLISNFFWAQAQYLPANDAVLHYRLVGFDMGKAAPQAKKYVLEIAMGHIDNEDSFNNSVFVRKESANTYMVATVPYWNVDYTWRITPVGKKPEKKMALAHFRTAGISVADTSLYRLRVTKNNMEENSLLFFSDATRGLYDVTGSLLWYVPILPGMLDTTVPIRDLRLTPQHTITFIANTQAYEIDYNGKLLWKAPDDGKVNGDTSEFYHHEFVKLSNGHYMIAGNEYVKKYLPASFAEQYPDNNNVKQENGRYYTIVAYGTLIEYDSDKKVVWSWKSSAYFTDEDLIVPYLFENDHIPGFHHNAFFFDEKNHVIYNSFRDINRLVKISYPGKQPLASYSLSGDGTLLFRGQHSCRINKAGDLYLFNNNFSVNKKKEAGKPSSVLILKEPKGKEGNMTVAWAFDCDIDKEAEPTAKGGGSVYELNDKSILTSMGTVNRIFIVKDNEVKWNAFTEIKNEGRWLPQSNYRVSPIEGEDNLEQMIFYNR